jgi:hypothetical protein
MIPAENHPVWTQIATGKKSMQCGKLAINLLAQSNKLSYERDPSPANVKKLADHTRAFFVQYEKAFTSEFAKILG